MKEEVDFKKYRPHPWHGLEVGRDSPDIVNVFVEICPTDFVKYEIDKNTGYLKVDRPQRSSSQHPTLYGFIPKTYCGKTVGKLMYGAKGGDLDPLDICVISERPITKSEVILRAKVVGVFPMLDKGEADYKIIAVLENDCVYNDVNDVKDLPEALVSRMKHYFSTYKQIDGEDSNVSISDPRGVKFAKEVILASVVDYNTEILEGE